jgi:hypothetical protein
MRTGANRILLGAVVCLVFGATLAGCAGSKDASDKPAPGHDLSAAARADKRGNVPQSAAVRN